MKRDPGLQPERTALAWRRTALAMLVNGGLLVRAASTGRSAPLWTIALLVVLAALLMFGIGWQRNRTLVLSSSPPAPNAAVLILVVGAVCLACGAAALSMLG